LIDAEQAPRFGVIDRFKCIALLSNDATGVRDSFIACGPRDRKGS